MRAFFDPRQLAHAPAEELHNGGFTPYAEVPARAEANNSPASPRPCCLARPTSWSPPTPA